MNSGLEAKYFKFNSKKKKNKTKKNKRKKGNMANTRTISLKLIEDLVIAKKHCKYWLSHLLYQHAGLPKELLTN